MRIEFRRSASGRSVATIHRYDGVVVELPSYSVTHRVPHDLAHAVAEREFDMADGVFGSIAAGGVFSNMRVVAGRPRHDAGRRSARVLRENKVTLSTAEVMAGVLHHAVEGGEPRMPVTKAAPHDWGIIRQEPFPWTDEQVLAAVETLRDLAGQWDRLGSDDALEFFWPDRMVRRRR